MKPTTPGAGFVTALGAITLLGPLAVHLFLPAMPAVKMHFAASDAVMQAIFSVTLVTMGVATPAYGSLSDRYGRRPVLLAGLGLFLLGSLVSSLAPSVPALIVGRLVQAMGAGCGVTLARAIARDAYGPAALVKAIAYLTMAYTLGPMIAPALGGILIDHFGWRSAFVFALLSGLAITVAVLLVVPETHAPSGRRDVAGILLQHVMLLRDRRFVAFVLQSGFMSFQFFAVTAASPFLMKDALGRSATEYGLYFMFVPVGFFSGNFVSSLLTGKVAIEKMVMAGSVLCAAVVVAQAILITSTGLSPLLIFVPAALMSVAQGLSLPNAQAGAIRVRPELAGTAAGLGVFVQLLLSALSAQLYGMFADGTPDPMIAISLVGSVLALASAASLFRRSTRPAESGRTAPPGGKEP